MYLCCAHAKFHHNSWVNIARNTHRMASELEWEIHSYNFLLPTSVFLLPRGDTTRHTCPQSARAEQADWILAKCEALPFSLFNFHFRFLPTSANTLKCLLKYGAGLPHMPASSPCPSPSLPSAFCVYSYLSFIRSFTFHSFFLRLRAEAFTSALPLPQSA